MLRCLLFASVATALGCGSSEPAPGVATAAPAAEAPRVTRTFTLRLSSVRGAPQATVAIDLPSTWAAEVATDGTPAFRSPRLTGMAFGLTAAPTDAVTPAARVEQALKWQYEGGAGVIRVPLSDGRVWAVRVEGRLTHARVFVPVDGGVVMAVAMLRDLSADQLAQVEAVFSTLRVAPSPTVAPPAR